MAEIATMETGREGQRRTMECASERRGSGELALEIRALKEEMEELRARQDEAEERYRRLATEKTALEAKISRLEASIWTAVPPFYFTLHNYTHYKKYGLRWRSLPFYSRPRGYKLDAEAVAGGSSVGEGSHVSVYISILRGENDDELPWPFRGRVAIRLLNERGQWGHMEKIIVFADDTPLVNSGRPGIERERSEGWGDPLFISHSNLAYNPVYDTEYLKWDRLRFVVSEIKE